MSNISENLTKWDRDHDWEKDGDEWADQAAFCGQPYFQWKQALVEEFIYAYIDGSQKALEIAPGHGRWTRFIIPRVSELYLVDLSPSCIDYCREQFNAFHHVRYIVNDGVHLTNVPDQSLDFIWSYDSFVHMEPRVIESYLLEMARVLKPGGTAVIHHANTNPFMLIIKNRLLPHLGKLGRKLHRKLFWWRSIKGWRSDASAMDVRMMAKRVGLKVVRQSDTWGKDRQYNCKLFGDCISVFQR